MNFYELSQLLVPPESPLRNGFKRLYRAETHKAPGEGPLPDWLVRSPEARVIKDVAGRWFYSTRGEAESFAKSFGGASTGVSYVDVPMGDFESYRVSNQPGVAVHSRRPDEEFFVPRDVADRRRLVK
jgi:hypothetical protein